MALTPEREGQIALIVVKNRMEKEGVMINKSTRRELGNLAKETGIDISELLELTRKFVLEMVDKYLK
ncbi:hypothetical protein KJ616_01090 [Patescibacteria group bacterium]|nr:hypothetical protein [Patescibacteria group bacterium]